MIIETHSNIELTMYVQGWLSGTYQHLYIQSFPGQGKTSLLKKLTDFKGNKVAWLTGHASPMAFYSALYVAVEEGAKFIIIDDIDGLLSKLEITSILKQCCDDKKKRTVMWTTSARLRDVDPEFECTAQFCILTNNVHGYFESTPHIQAIYDRCTTIAHLPTIEDTVQQAIKANLITREAGEFMTEQSFPAGFLSFRLLQEIGLMEKNGLDWQTPFEEHARQAQRYAKASARKRKGVKA